MGLTGGRSDWHPLWGDCMRHRMAVGSDSFSPNFHSARALLWCVKTVANICPATGHLVGYLNRLTAPPPTFCKHHGVALFNDCSHCGVPWPLIALGYSANPTHGADFCGSCGAPAPWLSRGRLMLWLRDQIQAERDMPADTRTTLQRVLERLERMAPDNTKATAGWERIRQQAPKVWEATKPVRDTLIGEAVKKALGPG